MTLPYNILLDDLFVISKANGVSAGLAGTLTAVLRYDFTLALSATKAALVADDFGAPVYGFDE